MFALIVYFISQLNATNLAIEHLEPNLDPAKRLEYAALIVIEAHKHDMDPLLVVAVIDRESDFRNLPRNDTDDYGLMQVHWQRADWLVGLKRSDLMHVPTNVKAGFAELAYWRDWCKKHRGRKGPKGHHWTGHYRSGNVVNDEHAYYGIGVIRTYKWLKRATQGKTKDRYRQRIERRYQS